MGTSFESIYARAVTRFDSPDITRAYEDNPIVFSKIMYSYLDLAISLFINPIEEIDRLMNYTDCDENGDSIIADGITDKFVLTSTPTESSYYSCSVNGISVNYDYDEVTQTFTLKEVPEAGSAVEISWYYPGSFNEDLTSQETGILSSLVAMCWAEQERNFQLDIRTIIGDKTYSIASSAKNSIGTKVAWYEVIREKAEKDMNAFAWSMYIIKKEKGSNIFGR